MKNEKIILNKQRNVYLEPYLLTNSKELKPDFRRPTIIICPGGGYKFLSDREAEPIALAYNAAGFHAVVLRYGVDEHAVMPGPVRDLANAIDYLYNAENLYIDKENIFVAGFSAGGHLATSLAVFWNDENVLPEYKEKPYIKPKGILLGYPVIDLKSTSTKLDIGIEGYPPYEQIEFDMLHSSLQLEDVFVRADNKTYINFEIAMNAFMFNGIGTDEQIEKYSLHKQVNKDTSPAFIWHGGYDDLIYPQNSLKLATAMYEHNIDCELHIYDAGGHGLSLGTEITSNQPWELIPEVTNWFAMSVTWIKNRSEKQ